MSPSNQKRKHAILLLYNPTCLQISLLVFPFRRVWWIVRRKSKINQVALNPDADLLIRLFTDISTLIRSEKHVYLFR